MCSCLRQTICLPKFFISSRTSSLKFFSAFSPAYDKFNNSHNPNNLLIKKINPPEHIRYRNFSLLQSLESFYQNVSSSEASKLTKDILISTHDFTGLPWFFTIIASSVVMKLLISVPCGIFQQHLISKIELTKLQLEAMVPSLKQKVLEKGRKGKWTKPRLQTELLKEIRQEWKALIVKNNCHPFKATILFFLQFPFWLVLTLTIRTLANDVSANQLDDIMTALQFKVGGLFWFKNLSQPDPIFILPIINFLGLVANTELSLARQDAGKVSSTVSAFIVTKFVPNFLRLFSLLFFFISAASPSGVSLFWASSTLIALSQNLLLMSPRVRRFLKIPKTPSESDRPYKKAWDSIKEKWKKFFRKK